MDFHRQSLSDRLSALLASVSGQRQPIPAASTPARLPEKKRELTAGEIETLPQVLDFIKATSNPKKIRDVVARFLQNPLLSENDRELVKKKVLEKIEEEKRKKEAKKASTEPNAALSSSSSSATTVCEPPKVEKHTTSEHGRVQPPRPAHEASQRGSASRTVPPPRASYGPQGKTVSEATSTRRSGTSSQASAGQSKQQAPQDSSATQGKAAQTGAAQNAGASSQGSAGKASHSQATADQQAKFSPQSKQEKAPSQGNQTSQQGPPSQGKQAPQEKAPPQSDTKSSANASAQQGYSSSKEAANSSKETPENRAPSDGDKPAAQDSKTEENNEAYLEQFHYVGDLVAKLRKLSEPGKVCSAISSEAPLMKEEVADPASYSEWVTSTPVKSSIPATTPRNMTQYSVPIGQSYQPCPGVMFPMQSSLFQVPPPNFDFRTAAPAANHSYAGFRTVPPLFTALPLSFKLTERDRIPRTPTPPSRSPEPRVRPGAVVAVLNESGRLVMPGARVIERTKKEQERVPEKDPLKEQEKPPEKHEQPTDIQMEEAARSKDCYTRNYALRHGVSLEEAERMIAREEWELRNEREREQWELRNRGEHEQKKLTNAQREEAARAKDCYTRNYALRHGVSLEEAERMIAREEWELRNEREREQWELRNQEARRAPKRRNEFESSREHDRYMKGFEPLPPNQKYAKNVNDEYDPYHPAYLPEPPPPPGYDHDFWRSRRAGYGPEEGEILNSSFDSTGTSGYYDPRIRYADYYSSYPGVPARERPPERRSLLDGL